MPNSWRPGSSSPTERRPAGIDSGESIHDEIGFNLQRLVDQGFIGADAFGLCPIVVETAPTGRARLAAQVKSIPTTLKPLRFGKGRSERKTRGPIFPFIGANVNTVCAGSVFVGPFNPAAVFRELRKVKLAGGQFVGFEQLLHDPVEDHFSSPRRRRDCR